MADNQERQNLKPWEARSLPDEVSAESMERAHQELEAEKRERAARTGGAVPTVWPIHD